MKHIFFSVGEPSGDIHAAAVIRHLQGFRISGITGDAMIAAGTTTIFHIRETSVIGFSEVARNYLRLRRILNKTYQWIEKERPDLLVLVDYPGFNMRLARFAKKLGIPVLYYIAPKVWAWGEWRVKSLRQVVDRMAVIFPFEENYFRERGIKADYVGNPSVETPHTIIDRKTFCKNLDIPESARILGLLSGSRKGEVEKILPPMTDSAKTLMTGKVFDYTLVSKMGYLSSDIFKGIKNDPRFRIVDGDPGGIYSHSDFLFVKSGTATLEAALELKPFLVAYKVALISGFIIRRVLSMKYVSMINIILGGPVVTELLQENVTSEKLTSETQKILSNTKQIAGLIETFKRLKEDMSQKKASIETASIIREMTNG